MFSQKVVPRNDLTWTNIHGFQAKRAMIWPQPWNSLTEFIQNWHDCASWDGKQWCRRDISTCFTKKTHFPFSKRQKGLLFVKRVPRASPRMAPLHYSLKVDHISLPKTKRHKFSSFLAILCHSNGFLPIQLETARFWTAAPSQIARYFS